MSFRESLTALQDEKALRDSRVESLRGILEAETMRVVPHVRSIARNLKKELGGNYEFDQYKKVGFK